MNRESVMAKKRVLLIGLIALIIAGITFGYAQLQTTLTITGETKISKVNWLVHFKNTTITDGSFMNLNSSNVAQNKVELSNNDTTLTYSVTLNQPGDFFEFKTYIANDGTIDAKLESLTQVPTDANVGSKPYITYTKTGLPAVNSVLQPGASNYIPVTIRFEYPLDITPEELPTADYTFSETITLGYVQNR
jgi:hypothetical protein